MKKLERIKQNVDNCKDLKFENLSYMTKEEQIQLFIKDAFAYIKAIKEGRMLCVIHSVSKSGMSRNISFHSFEFNKHRSRDYNKGYYRQYIRFFKALGYNEKQKTGEFKVYGCGMNMVFHTNYCIIYKLYSLGFINKKECDRLAQETPVVL